jgi:sterol desaturase/sphingolipid hydroxylase (fatty acid hydroxylase superfamily)
MPIYLQYYFWLILVSLGCFLLERIAPWRREQRVLRRGLVQDLFWLVFNGHFLGLLLALWTGHVVAAFNTLLRGAGLPLPESLALLGGAPLWVQFVVFVVLKDFVEWNIHRLLHNVPWLWELHKLHHSIEELDWIGNFRFHWGEVIVYKTLSYLPLVVLGVDGRVLLAIAVLWTVMLDINHANVGISWGPLRYVLNSPKMHVWHHDVKLHGKGGQNFGQVLSVWDWVFGTVYWPADRDGPKRLGFAGMEAFPDGVPRRLLYPFWKGRRGRPRPDAERG